MAGHITSAGRITPAGHLTSARRWRLLLIISLVVSLAECAAPTPADPTAERMRQVAEQAHWGTNVKLSFDGDTMIVQSNGLPNHAILPIYQALSLIDNKTVYQVEPREMWMRLAIPLNPKLAETRTPTRIGVIGILISGALLYGPYEADGSTVALDANFVINNIPFIDNCNGHPNPFALQYHYHGVPYCITRTLDQPGKHSFLLGYVWDGFPVYGPQGEGGKLLTRADLDECDGHFGPTPEFPEGIYHYHLLTVTPYSLPCYSGVVDLSASPVALVTRGVDVAAYWWVFLVPVALLVGLSVWIVRRRGRRQKPLA